MPMSCAVCGRDECDGTCATPRSPAPSVRDVALRAAERRQARSPGDTLPDYEDEDGDEDEDDALDEDAAS